MANKNGALFNSPNIKRKVTSENSSETTEERYERMQNMSDEELMGRPSDLPELDIESLKKSKHFDKMEYEETENITTTVTPTPGMNSETFYLPSRNLLYGEDFDGHFNMRMFTTREERLRISSRDTFLQTMCSILNNCITTENGVKVDTKWFTEFDFIYTMYMARIISYGPLYNIETTCPFCLSRFKHTTNLDNLKINYLEDTFQEPINLELPMSKDKIALRFLRIEDRIEMDKEASEIRLNNPDYVGDPIYNLKMEYMLVTVNGEELPKSAKKTYIENLPGMDAQFINYKMNKFDAGIDTDITVECPHCHKNHVNSLAMNSTFFRPEFDS